MGKIKIVRRSNQSFSEEFEEALARFARLFVGYATSVSDADWLLVISIKNGVVLVHYEDGSECWGAEVVAADFDPELLVEEFKLR